MGKRPPTDGLGRRRLGALIERHPRLLKILDRHGVTFCSGCYLTLHAPLSKAAAYHAVGNLERFYRDVRRALKKRG